MSDTTAAQIMTRPVVTIGPDALLTDAIPLLLRHRCSGLPVIDRAENLVGIITEHDILNVALRGDAADLAVAEAMTQAVVHLPPSASLASVVNCLLENHFRRVPIVEDKRVVGIVSRHDILREILARHSTYQ